MEVIAEIGSNWKTARDCLRSVEIAKDCGADVVKFQYYTNEDLYGIPGDRECKPPVSALSDHAKQVGIEFMCTAFSAKGYRFIDPLVKRHKVASSEITDYDILNELNLIRKPVLLSTGGASLNEINNALLVLRNCKVTLLFCVAEYPAKIIDFAHMLRFTRRWPNIPVGYSDHSIDVMNIPLIAQINGATVIEKHVNFTPYIDTPDAPHSLSEHEFRIMCRALKNKTTYDETFRPNPWKRKMIALPDGRKGYFRPRSHVGK